MSENKERKITLPSGGVVNDILVRIKLIVRLLADRRINPLLKVLPVGTLAYFLIPDLLPGPLDDAAIIWLGTFLFVELCPPEIVQEHMTAINQTVPGQWQDPLQGEGEEVVDAEFREEN